MFKFAKQLSLTSKYLLIGSLMVALMVAGACGSDDDDAPAVATSETKAAPKIEAPAVAQEATVYGEAPMLADQVITGSLPPVEERLPETPMVINTFDAVGEYGGEIRRAYLGSHLSCNFGRPIREGLVRPDNEGGSILMAVAKSVEPNSDGTVWTVTLRGGMHWSDGEPFTADDFLFQAERVENEELTGSKPLWYEIKGSGNPATVAKVDAETITYTFAKPNYTWKEALLVMDGDCGRPNGGHRVPYAPKHYLKDFFPGYGKSIEELNAAAEAEGFDNWVGLYLRNNTDIEGADKPTMRMCVLDSGITGERIICNRNPYFYAVDQEGNQLPYIDRWIFDKVEDKAALNLKAISGDIDFQSRHIDLMNLSLYKENEEKGGFKTFLYPSLEENDAALAVNITVEGPKREYFANADFRHALSYAIDREAINEIAFLGLGVVRNLMPKPDNMYYPGPELEQKYMNLDVAKANEILDGIMPDKDGDGYRLMSNGERMSIDIWNREAFAPFPEMAEMIINNWKAIGIHGNNNSDMKEAQTLAYKENTNDMLLYHHIASGMPYSYPDKIAPVMPGTSNSSMMANGQWYASGGTDGIEPTDPFIIELQENWKTAATLPDAERAKAGQRFYSILAEQQYFINIIAHSPATQGTNIVSNGLGNVPETAANSWPHRTPSTAFPEQFYWKDASRR